MLLARSFFALAVAMFLSAQAQATAGCSRAALADAASGVRQARTALIAVPVGEMDTDVPPGASAALEHLKDRLQAYVRISMACMPSSASVKSIAARLKAQGDAGKRGPDTDGHGRDLDYSVDPLPNHPGWITIVPSFDIQCGSDAIALFYRRDSARWREAMVLRAAPYKEVSGGWEGVDITASPAGADGRWYVALARRTPWCTSTWSAYHLMLARPTANPFRPDIFLKRDLSYNRGYNTAIAATPRWFEVRLVDWSHDIDILVRTSIHRWAIDGDRTRRIPPVAPTAQDFVDEWLETPWREASAWSATSLKALHNQLGFADGNQKDVGTSFDQIRACPRNRIEVALQPEAGPDYYLMVEQKGVAFRLTGVSRRHDARCTGPDQKHQHPLLGDQ